MPRLVSLSVIMQKARFAGSNVYRCGTLLTDLLLRSSAPEGMWESIPHLTLDKVWGSLAYTMMDEATGGYVDLPWLGLGGVLGAVFYPGKLPGKEKLK